MNKIVINMPAAVREIIERLEGAGFEAFAVGGCVRDAVLGREPADWDITTSALPLEVKALFSRTIDTGLQHGTVTVMRDHVGYEVTTYRIDGEYEDARRPKEVSFTKNLVEDLKRRDFTINAMAYNDRVGIVDEFDGIGDLERKVIRCVGVAEDRFGEDALRMLRAVRFSAQLGFSIEEKTKEAIGKLAENLKKISAERIQVELVKLLVSDHPDYLRMAYETGITTVVLPEFDDCMRCPQIHPFHIYNVGEHTLHSLLHVENDKVLRLAMLFHDFGKPVVCKVGDDGITHFHGHQAVSAQMAKDIMKRLKFDNDTMDKVVKLVTEHDRRFPAKRTSVRRALSKIGRELFPMYLKVRRADILAQNPDKHEEQLAILADVEKLFEDIAACREAVSVKELEIDGKDLLAVGVPQGKLIGKILNGLLEMVLEEPKLNQKETLLDLVKEYLDE